MSKSFCQYIFLDFTILVKYASIFLKKTIFFLLITQTFLCLVQSDENVIAIVGKYPVKKNQVFDLLLLNYPNQVQTTVEELIIYSIIRQEAQKENLGIKKSFVYKKAKKDLENYQNKIEQFYGQNWQDYLKSNGISAKKLVNIFLKKWKYKIALQRLSELRGNQVEARHIMVNSEHKAEKILQKLKKHGNFETLVQQESLSATKKYGGKLPTVKRGTMPQALEKVIFRLKPYEISGVVKSKWGYHIIQVLKIIPGTPDATWRELKNKVIESLTQKPLNKLDLERWIKEMKKKYKIKRYRHSDLKFPK